MRFDVLVNGGAGSVGDEGDQTQAIVEAFAAAGAQADVQVVDPAALADRVRACWAAAARPAAVLVAGGDGTVSAAAGAAVGADIVIGVVPLGTFNHFAKDLGVPANLAGAAQALAAGEVRCIDAAQVNGRTFVNNSVLGLYPDLVAVRDRIRDRRGWGKVRAVPVAAIQVLRRFSLHRLDLVGPGYSRRRVRTPLVFVGNGVFANVDGGAPERTDLADGTLGVAVAHVVTRRGLVRAAVQALWRGAHAAPDLDTVALTELTVTSRVRHVRVAIDGEIAWMDAPLRYQVLPGALQVWAPRSP